MLARDVFRFFFFQAEDGIRDHCVTGVQTCALPISWWNPSYLGLLRAGAVIEDDRGEQQAEIGRVPPSVEEQRGDGEKQRRQAVACPQIGRASCRERV